MSKPRLVQWRSKWYVFYTDPISGKQVRRSCLRAKAVTPEDHLEFLDQIARDVAALSHEIVLRGGALAYNASLATELRRYVASVKRRVRDGEIAPDSLTSILKTIDPMVEWASDLPTGALDGPKIQAFISERTEGLAVATANLHRRNVKAALKWLDTSRPKLFPDSGIFWPALKRRKEDDPRGTALSATAVQALYEGLPDDGQRYLFHFYAVTGCRREEPETARLDGRILVLKGKRGRTRYVPLTGGEIEVAPKLLALLKDRGMPPAIIEGMWRYHIDLLPQVLRKNFTSWCASMGLPPAICAMWQGHSLAVAEAYYRQQLLEPTKADSLERALGF